MRINAPPEQLQPISVGQSGLLRVGQQVGGVIKMAGLFLTTQCVKRDQCANSRGAVRVTVGRPIGRRCEQFGWAFLLMTESSELYGSGVQVVVGWRGRVRVARR